MKLLSLQAAPRQALCLSLAGQTQGRVRLRFQPFGVNALTASLANAVYPQLNGPQCPFDGLESGFQSLDQGHILFAFVQVGIAFFEIYFDLALPQNLLKVFQLLQDFLPLPLQCETLSLSRYFHTLRPFIQAYAGTIISCMGLYITFFPRGQARPEKGAAGGR